MLRKTMFLILFALLHPPDISAQDLENRTEEMHPFGKIIISSESLPDKVYEVQKNKILISVRFFEKGTSNIITSSVGTGFVTESPGTIITARHLLDGPLAEAEKIKKEKIKSNPKFDYGFMFVGTIITNTAWINFPLSFMAVGEKETLKDMLALRTDVETMQRAQMLGDIFNPNPYGILMKTSKFADANLGEKVYISGFAPILAEYPDKNNRPTSVYMDLINHTFSAEVEIPITDMPGNRAGIKTLYRLRDSAEPGFSGGKVINSQGQVIGITMAMSKNFVYVISSKDIKDFLKDNNLK